MKRVLVRLALGVVVVGAVVALFGCPPSGNAASVQGIWDCFSFTPEHGLSEESVYTFRSDGRTVRIEYPGNGTYYELFWEQSGPNVTVYGQNYFRTSDGAHVPAAEADMSISTQTFLSMKSSSRMSGETWQTVRDPWGTTLYTIYSTETATRR